MFAAKPLSFRLRLDLASSVVFHGMLLVAARLGAQMQSTGALLSDSAETALSFLKPEAQRSSCWGLPRHSCTVDRWVLGTLCAGSLATTPSALGRPLRWDLLALELALLGCSPPLAPGELGWRITFSSGACGPSGLDSGVR